MDLSGTVDRVEAIRRKFGVESLAPQLAACREYLNLAERSAGAAEAARFELIEALARERRAFGSVKGELRLLCNHLQAEVRTEEVRAVLAELDGLGSGVC